MLLGTYEHTIDDKNRLTLPAKFRQAFADGVFVTRGLEGSCLYAYRREDWDRLVKSRLASLDPLSKEGRQMHRFFFAPATEAELDKQGRVMLPAALIEMGKLGREVVVAGVNDRLEIWDRDAWRRELATIEGSAEDVAERLAAKRD
jgi:MraZ protein